MLGVGRCPGFGQERVNFCQKPGGDTAGRADPTWPNRTGYSIPCAAMLGSGGGSCTAGSRSRLGSVWLWRAVRVLCSTVLFCVFFLSVSLLFLFPLFPVLLNCPYPDPPVSACFFPFSSAPRRGEGQPRGTFVASHSQIRTEGTSVGHLVQPPCRSRVTYSRLHKTASR